jgi:hypothetical protein
VGIIVLSILSALTNSPLVIQRQVKALRRLGLSGPSDLYAEYAWELTSPLTLSMVVSGLCIITVGSFVVDGILPSRHGVQLVDIVIFDICAVFYAVAYFCLIALGTWMLRYFRYFASPLVVWFSGLYRGLLPWFT